MTRRTPEAVHNAPATSSVQFNVTPVGRVYQNGLQLRASTEVVYTRLAPYFPSGVWYYPNYLPTYARGSVSISPFGYYYGVCAPYINPYYCYNIQPTAMFVMTPSYNGNISTGYAETQQRNWLGRNDLSEMEPGLSDALDKLTETYQDRDIDALVPLLDPDIPVAVYQKGDYQYSLSGNDYADLTRDAIASIHSVSFEFTDLQKQSDGVFSASGVQSYTDASGDVRKVYVSFALWDADSHWTLLQVDTAPDTVQPWQ